MLDKSSAVPLYAQLAEKLKEKILKGEWKDGEKIPPEFELMEKYGVSRATVRTAIDTLVAEGFLVKRHGVGTFVRKFRPTFSFEPLISLNYALETFGFVSKNVVLKKAYVKLDENLSCDARWKSVQECFLVKRLRYVDEFPIVVEESYFHPEIAKAIENEDLTRSLAKVFFNSVKDIEITRIEQIIEPCTKQEAKSHVQGLIDTDTFLKMSRWIYIKNYTEPVYYLLLFMRNDLSKLRG
ncbi:MAG: Transcriptional regulator, GntR family [Thermotoga sp. 50_1627]|nr:MAG: Transcriptional regulator, GntR family [Thermotoga sp. 50_64]KUK24932.1 MAG: Transcriptional regulator, GntR family [Thermotoga sp. 50_1627]MBC7116680.1 GntR family transcriptional regulator [Pseudothermotoga sp.]MDK2922739.1 GntR family transcriptional regulator [Pseudothermotoga sp.]HBT39284.1 GntR family transcriptional regulator [Pseudothermotoga sp.]